MILFYFCNGGHMYTVEYTCQINQLSLLDWYILRCYFVYLKCSYAPCYYHYL
jgi:hypothetical protein